jgi:hypothetical protein
MRESGPRTATAAMETLVHEIQFASRDHGDGYVHPLLASFLRSGATRQLREMFLALPLAEQQLPLAVSLCLLYEHVYASFIAKELVPFLCEQLSISGPYFPPGLAESVQILCACSGLCYNLAPHSLSCSLASLHRLFCLRRLP